MRAFLILEDGHVFTGTSIGSAREVISEIVFNTSMAGYLEVFTDPSYAGQAVLMTYPIIGSYGICYEDMESSRPWVDGVIVRELTRIPSNFRSEDTIQNFLEKNDVPGIAGIDTRALTKILIEKGNMKGMITTNENYVLDEVISKLKEYKPSGLVDKVTCDKVSKLGDGDKKVALLDLGAKKSVAAALNDKGCEVTVYPAGTSADTILGTNPDGIVISNGPGNPKDCAAIIEEIKKIYASDVPVLGIGLGHQLMALATGADTVKMKCGHGGSNYPVRNEASGQVVIQSQNHSYVVDESSVKADVAEVAFVNVNDKTVEGLRYKNKKIVTVQYYPSGRPVPMDVPTVYEEFIGMMN